jgi:hypothetical protein
VNIPVSIGIISFSLEYRSQPWLRWIYDQFPPYFNNIFSSQRANSNFPHLSGLSLYFQHFFN